MRRAPILFLSTSLVMAAAAASAVAAPACPLPPIGSQPVDGVPGNRLLNPGAEDATLAPWTVAGVARVAAYGAEPGVPDLAFSAERHDGHALFATGDQQPASLTQDVSAAGLTGREIQVGGLLTNSAGQPDPGTVKVLALDERGTTVGQTVASSVTADPQLSGTTTYRFVVGFLTVPTSATTLRVEATIAPGSAGGTVSGLDGLYLTDQPGYGAVPAYLCIGPGNPPPSIPQPIPQPQPQPPKAGVSPKAQVRSLPKAVRSGGRLRVRLVNVTKGHRLEIRWTKAGKRRASQRLTITTSSVRLKAPRPAGSYRVELRYDGALLHRAAVRVTR